jgi:hypothetical protein
MTGAGVVGVPPTAGHGDLAIVHLLVGDADRAMAFFGALLAGRPAGGATFADAH